MSHRGQEFAFRVFELSSFMQTKLTAAIRTTPTHVKTADLANAVLTTAMETSR